MTHVAPTTVIAPAVAIVSLASADGAGVSHSID